MVHGRRLFEVLDCLHIRGKVFIQWPLPLPLPSNTIHVSKEQPRKSEIFYTISVTPTAVTIQK